MPTDARPRLDLAMPVHNEGPSIERTLEEWQAELSVAIDLRFLIAEDGSTDDTKEVLTRLEKRLPMHLDIAAGRRGYGHALKAALLAAETDYVLTCDSDGQIDPRDFWSVWAVREQHDLIVGWRVRRADHWFRKLMSGSFKLYHRLLFGTELHDPGLQPDVDETGGCAADCSAARAPGGRVSVGADGAGHSSAPQDRRSAATPQAAGQRGFGGVSAGTRAGHRVSQRGGAAESVSGQALLRAGGSTARIAANGASPRRKTPPIAAWQPSSQKDTFLGLSNLQHRISDLQARKLLT